jgi:tetratricopeptide (TPR) repeat protein
MLLVGCEGVVSHGGTADVCWKCLSCLKDFYTLSQMKGDATPSAMPERCKAILDDKKADCLIFVGLACEVLLTSGNYELVEEFCRRRLDLQHELLQTDPWNLAWTYGQLCEALLGQDRIEEAQEAAEKCQRLQRAGCSQYTPQWYRPISLIGRCDWKQGRYAAAESRLVEAFEGVSSYGTGTEHDVREEFESLNRLVSFYEDWNREDPSGGYDQLAAKYRSMLDRYQDVPARAQSDSLPESN